MSLPATTLLNLLADASLAKRLDIRVQNLNTGSAQSKDLVLLAEQHGLSALVYNTITQYDLSKHIEDEGYNKLKYVYYRNLSDNLLRLETLKYLRASLPTAIPLLVLKGPALIQHIYKNPALRPMVDIDLLVHPHHLPELQTCFRDLGFYSPAQYPDIFLKDRVTFDIHTDPFHTDRIADRNKAVPIDLQKLWEDAKPLNDQTHLLELSLPHQILTLAIHALKHGYDRNIWLFDIQYCLKKAENEGVITEVENTCRESNALPILAHTLHAIETHLQQQPPPSLSKLQKSFPIGRFGRKILDVTRQSGEFQILEPLILSKQFSGRLNQFRFLVSFAFPKLEVLTQISGLTGKITRWLSYPYRIIQLIGLGCLQLIKIIYRLLGTKSP